MWKTVKLGDVIEKTETVNPAAKFPSESFEYIDVSSVSKERLEIEETQTLLGKDAPSRARRRVHKDDVIFATVRPTLKRVAVVPKELDGQICSTGYIVLRGKRDVLLPRYLFHWMSSRFVMDYVASVQTGASYPAVTDKQVKEIDIHLPPLAEQQRIVAKLDAAFAEIDTKIATALSKIENAMSFEASLLDAALRGIDASKHSFTLQQLLDMGWIESHLDGNHGSDYPRKSEFIDEGVPYISANCIHDGKVVMNRAKHLSADRAAKLRKGIAKNGDVLFAHNATVGPTAILQTNEEKVILGTSLTYYRCNDEKISNEYLLAFMRSKAFITQYNDVMRQATRNQVPITKQRTFTFLVPDIDVQRKVAETVGRLRELTSKIIRKTDASMQQLNSLKSAILAQELQPPQSEAA